MKGPDTTLESCGIWNQGKGIATRLDPLKVVLDGGDKLSVYRFKVSCGFAQCRENGDQWPLSLQLIIEVLLKAIRRIHDHQRPIIGLIILLTAIGCNIQNPPESPTQKAVTATPIRPAPDPSLKSSKKQNPFSSLPKFHDASSDVGINFTYLNGADDKLLMVIATGGGGGWIDFDGDGLLDLYLCQGGDPATADLNSEPVDQLFRQVTPNQFESVTPHFGVREVGYSQGVSVGDFDDDGFDDIFISNVGPDSLLRNQGDGTFQETAASAGVANPLWSTSSAWGDIDRDGDLDLYVCTYADFDPYNPKRCVNKKGEKGICHPKHVPSIPDECYINQGDGTFTPEARQRGLFGEGNRALGVVIADLNNDDWADVFVANDTTANFLYINQGHGDFLELAHSLGCAVSREGLPQANMGIALGDYDHNGWLDLYVTHFTHESNTLYKNLGKSGFQDVTGLVGLHTPTFDLLGFGTVMSDFNLDGHEDIFVANGHVNDLGSLDGDERDMPAQLFTYEGPKFVECSRQAGEFFSRKGLGRGVACGDFDNDGDWDLAIVFQNSPTAILRNDSERGHWLKLRFRAKGNRRGIGTRAVVKQGDTILTQELAGGTSYASAHESALIFGLGENDARCDLLIRWPDGTSETVNGVKVDQQITLRQSE